MYYVAGYFSYWKARLTKETRRITEILLDYWGKARKGRKFPAMENVNLEQDLQDIWPDCFITEITENDGKKQYHQKYMGDNIHEMFGGTFTNEVLEVLSIKVRPLYSHVEEHKRPLIEESQFINSRNKLIKYRQIILPLGKDDTRVDHLLGGVRYKMYDLKESENTPY